MNKANTDYLISSFPKLYCEANHLDSLENPFSVYGFECGDGWFSLLKELSSELTLLIESTPVKCINCDQEVHQHNSTECERYSPTWPHAVQVKEKFGSLRFYMEGAVSPAMYSVIDAFESSSLTICEACGSLGELRKTMGWWAVRCDVCAKKERRLK